MKESNTSLQLRRCFIKPKELFTEIYPFTQSGSINVGNSVLEGRVTRFWKSGGPGGLGDGGGIFGVGSEDGLCS